VKKIILNDGTAAEVNAAYFARLIEQRKGVPAPAEKPKKEPKGGKKEDAAEAEDRG